MKERIFPIIIALSALSVSASAAFYSVFGLSKLFAGASMEVIIMAGGAGVGKSYLLTQLGLSSLPQVNPDKYVEDPEHPAYNNLGAGARLADKEAEDLAASGTSFVWDTTASNPKKVQDLKDKGYDIYMIMVYTHPMISYISNFERKRNTPGSTVFLTWRNSYQKIKELQKIYLLSYQIKLD